ncbi:MAG: sigma-70 family RNA polymerase sigma factor [Thermoguttaceae bacterium]|nr:sigma-70 family RNA polymerase sigma factor [Thermoguttaceae bacterium]
MSASNDRFGISPQEYRELRARFIQATTPAERAKIFNLLLNQKMYGEFAEIARRYKREKGQIPDIDTISLVNQYLAELLAWWYHDPAKIIRFEELGNFIAYSRAALQWALLAKLKPSKELTGQDDAPEPFRADDFIAEIVGQDAFDKLVRQIQESLTPLEFDVFTARLDAFGAKLTYAALAARLSTSPDSPQTYTEKQVERIYKQAQKKARFALKNYWRDESN